MHKLLRSLAKQSLFLALFFVVADVQTLSAYVVIPRNADATTDRMNAGGDPPTRPGLRDAQRSPEYLDDWWGRNDYYYSEYGIRETGRIRDPVYNSDRPPFYPYPNNNYYNTSPFYNSPQQYNYSNRYYRPGYPR